jgi:hypothetical protein
MSLPPNPLSRRKTLALIGGGAILAATAGAGLAVTRAPRTALLPWQDAGSYDEPRRRALSWALLSPNPHNRQPWLADLSTEGEVTLYVDTERLLPHTDPYNRQITIGLGCFLELMRMAAAEDGFRVDLALFPRARIPQGLMAARSRARSSLPTRASTAIRCSRRSRTGARSRNPMTPRVR